MGGLPGYNSHRLYKMQIFTNKQIIAINKRANGNRDDSTGIFCSRCKPKIKHIIKILKEPNALEFWQGVLDGKNKQSDTIKNGN